MARDPRQPAENESAAMAAAFDILSVTHQRYKRERAYRLLTHVLDAELVTLLRQRFNDEAASEIRTCACGQRNRINLMSPQDGDVGPRCGRCGAALDEAASPARGRARA